MSMLAECHGPNFEWFQLSGPADVCMGGTARRRTFAHGFNSDYSTCIADPAELAEYISDVLPMCAHTEPCDFFLAPNLEVRNEAERLAYKRDIVFKHEESDLKYLLLQHEWENLQLCEAQYKHQFGFDACDDPNLLIFLDESAASSKSMIWSAASTDSALIYRNNSRSGMFWSPYHRRWLTARERLASMSWPVVEPIAEGLDVNLLPTFDAVRAGDLALRGGHLASAAIQQLIALVCFGPKGA